LTVQKQIKTRERKKLQCTSQTNKPETSSTCGADKKEGEKNKPNQQAAEKRGKKETPKGSLIPPN